MTSVDVARKDFTDAIRSRWLWILSVVTVFAFCAPVVFPYYLGIDTLSVTDFVDDPTLALVTVSRGLAVIVLPLLTFVMCYASITRERESGSIKVLLSLPHARRDIVFGTFLGRTAAVLLPVAISLVLAGLLLAGISGLQIGDFLPFVAATFLFVVALAAIGVGLSGKMDTTRRAVLASIVAFAVFLVFWNPIAGFVASAIQGLASLLGSDVSQSAAFTIENLGKLMNPIEAYKDLIAPYSVATSVGQNYSRQIGTAPPIYLQAPFSILVLLTWTVGSLLVGTRHFEGIDL